MKQPKFLNNFYPGAKRPTNRAERPGFFYGQRALLASVAPVAFFIRHGETDLNAQDDFRGDLDVPLNDTGAAQAQQLVTFFKNQPISAFYNSSRIRTMQTLAPLLKDRNMTSKTIKDLDSLDTGNFAGQPKSKENEAKMDWYRQHPDAQIPGGDVIRDWQNRVDKSILDVIKEGAANGVPTAACVHGSVIKEVSRLLHNDVKKANVDPGGVVGIYAIPGGGFIARALLDENDTSEDLPLGS